MSARRAALALALAACRRDPTGDIVFDDTGDTTAEAAGRLPDCATDACVTWDLGGYTPVVTPDGAGGIWAVVRGSEANLQAAGCAALDPNPGGNYTPGWLVHRAADGACDVIEPTGDASGEVSLLPGGRLALHGEYFPFVQLGDQSFDTSPGVTGRYQAIREADGTWSVVVAHTRHAPLADLRAVMTTPSGGALALGSASENDAVFGQVAGEGQRFDLGFEPLSVGAGPLPGRPGLAAWFDAQGRGLALSGHGGQGGNLQGWLYSVSRLEDGGWATGATASQGFNSFNVRGAGLSDGGALLAFSVVQPFQPLPEDQTITLEGGATHGFGWMWMGTAVARLDAEGAWAWSWPVAEAVPWQVIAWGSQAWVVMGHTGAPGELCRATEAGFEDCRPYTGLWSGGDALGHLWTVQGDGYAGTASVSRAGPVSAP